jgi:glycosyltransferase involved in cell wall biosynthesis
MSQKEGYTPKHERKKILLMCDDIRMHSGVANVGKDLVLQTAHKYNWINIGAAINHPETGKKLDISAEVNKIAGIEDSEVAVIPSNGYGDPMVLRQLLHIEKPDAIFLITDPRYWAWLFQIENEIRRNIPIVYLNIWDDYPAPQYNEVFYESCDALLAISKQTKNINQIVLGEKAQAKIIEYVPHGINEDIFKPILQDSSFTSFRNRILGEKASQIDFVLLFNSRNIRRKQIPDTILAYKHFIDQLPEEKAKKCAFVLHTQPVDENGTDLHAVVEYLCSDEKYNIIFSENPLNPNEMNYLYNMADATILLTSNEGWGLSLTESLLTGTCIIANVTGGMQDQMRFTDKKGKWIDFTPDFPSNHRGTYKECGEWAFPVFPTNLSIQGSVPTPYIYDDRCSWEDAAEQIKAVFDLPKGERTSRGMKGREWAMGTEAGFTAKEMGKRAITAMDKLFATWTPREKYEFLKDSDFKKRVLNHKLVY